MRDLEDFAGHWRLSRRIVQADGPEARFEGEAVWTPDGAGLTCEERGLLQIGDQPALQGTRRYLWRPGLQVFFDDGRFFHAVPVEGGRAEHHCAPDHYVVDYDFSGWPSFATVWTVEGPRKSYRMASTYTR
ncbi:DUF6314 family protein [Chachezhania sediminis]|uniref:DUF6314 family protein n=1 Tax=Chachezhania sediminis TaxID=2599291 RepID=UPI001E45534A|nr:DUF6314 family protein [Chachezhania sediminis]